MECNQLLSSSYICKYYASTIIYYDGRFVKILLTTGVSSLVLLSWDECDNIHCIKGIKKKTKKPWLNKSFHSCNLMRYKRLALLIMSTANGTIFCQLNFFIRSKEQINLIFACTIYRVTFAMMQPFRE